MIDRKTFFDAIRGSFPGGKLSQKQVDGMSAILDACEAAELPNIHTAYVLATARREVGKNMFPVREGFKADDRAAAAHVRMLLRKKIITRDYSIPHKTTGKRYFGRGYVQLTWYSNYSSTSQGIGVDVVNNPDLMLDPAISAKAMVWGMATGSYRKGRSLAMIQTGTRAEFVAARDMINGDGNRKYPGMKKNIGEETADFAEQFLAALEA